MVTYTIFMFICAQMDS